jgi:hypothetical protein
MTQRQTPPRFAVAEVPGGWAAVDTTDANKVWTDTLNTERAASVTAELLNEADRRGWPIGPSGDASNV